MKTREEVEGFQSKETGVENNTEMNVLEEYFVELSTYILDRIFDCNVEQHLFKRIDQNVDVAKEKCILFMSELINYDQPIFFKLKDMKNRFGDKNYEEIIWLLKYISLIDGTTNKSGSVLGYSLSNSIDYSRRENSYYFKFKSVIKLMQKPKNDYDFQFTQAITKREALGEEYVKQKIKDENLLKYVEVLNKRKNPYSLKVRKELNEILFNCFFTNKNINKYIDKSWRKVSTYLFGLFEYNVEAKYLQQDIAIKTYVEKLQSCQGDLYCEDFRSEIYPIIHQAILIYFNDEFGFWEICQANKYKVKYNRKNKIRKIIEKIRVQTQNLHTLGGKISNKNYELEHIRIDSLFV